MNYMNLRDTCYFCTSPFQFIPIIDLALSRQEKADLYIDPQFEDANQFAERIKSTGIFCNVELIDSELIYGRYFTVRQGLLNHFQIARSYLKVNEIAKLILLKDTYYKNMFVSSRAFIPRLITLYFIKNNIQTKLLYFEDGTGSYLGNLAYYPRLTDKIVRRVLFGKEALDFAHIRYLFSPEFFLLLNNEYNNISIKKIPPILGNRNLIEVLNNVFSCGTKSLIHERFIILDVLQSFLFDVENQSKLIDIYKLLICEAGYSETIIKKHPRNSDNEIENARYYSFSGIPFECICINTDMNIKVLISYGSTSVGTPKLLLNQEPFVILLYRLIKSKDKSYDKLMEAYFSKLQCLYSDKSKIIIPENFDELRFAVNKIKDLR